MAVIAFGFNMRSLIIGAVTTLASLCVYSDSMADAGKVAISSPEQRVSQEAMPKDWKAYDNAIYRYHLRYPSSAELDAHDPADVFVTFVEPFSTGQDELALEVIVQPKPKSPLREWIHQQLGGDDDDNIVEETPTRVGGHEGYRVKNLDGDQQAVHYYVVRRGMIFEIKHGDPATMGELPDSGKAHAQQLLQHIFDSLTIE